MDAAISVDADSSIMITRVECVTQSQRNRIEPMLLN